MFGFGEKIDIDAITAELEDNRALLVDVREKEEWDSLHAKGALHFSVDRIMNNEVPTKDKTKKLYLYCVSGARASRATEILKEHGYSVRNLGGLSSWKRVGGATESQI